MILLTVLVRGDVQTETKRKQYIVREQFAVEDSWLASRKD